ncbi:MAG: aminopeptidase P N-terminal domain-containing protein, partial [Candidatus Sericytochromatia bacterium]
MSDFANHQTRRRALATRLDGAAALFPAGRAKTRSHTIDYAFRPDSDFFYLTGFDEPDAALLLLPGDDRHETVLFLRDRDPGREAWDGPRLGVAAAPAALGVDAAYPISELESRLPGLLAGRETLCYPLGRHPEWDAAVTGVWNGKGRAASLNALTHPRSTLHELRLRKDAHEVAAMRRAADVTARGFEAAIAAIRPGVSERAVRAAVLHAFAASGAEGPAYEPIVAGGARATVLHAPATERVLALGELVLVDMGAEVGWYASDVTRTYPVGGRFSPAQRAV